MHAQEDFGCSLDHALNQVIDSQVGARALWPCSRILNKVWLQIILAFFITMYCSSWVRKRDSERLYRTVAQGKYQYNGTFSFDFELLQRN